MAPSNYVGWILAQQEVVLAVVVGRCCWNGSEAAHEAHGARHHLDGGCTAAVGAAQTAQKKPKQIEKQKIKPDPKCLTLKWQLVV